jgi:hypothetical protein
MTEQSGPAFRLTVLNPSGRDPQQSFADGVGEPNSKQHAPVNFHGYAACSRGSFQRDTEVAIAEGTPVLLLLRGDFKASQRALVALKKQGRQVAVSLKETGLHQIADQLSDSKKLARFNEIVAQADGCIACTPEAANFYKSARDPATVRFIPTPYPMSDERWNFSRPFAEREGIFIGTREWDVPSRNHLAALLMASRLSEKTNQSITVYNKEGRKGAQLLEQIRIAPGKLRTVERYAAYPEYLREMARHRVVLQLDRSSVPGQVAGDALLCRLPCVGGNGAVDRLGFSDTRDFDEVEAIVTSLLTDDEFYTQAVAESQRRANEKLSFEAIAPQLANFFAAAAAPIASK